MGIEYIIILATILFIKTGLPHAAANTLIPCNCTQHAITYTAVNILQK